MKRVGGATILREPCELSISDLTILGLADEHVPGHGPPHMSNVIFVVEANGLRCCHWGDNRADPPTRIIEQIGRVDILMLPIDDSCHLLQYTEIDSLVDRLSPRVVVPMHYFSPKVSDTRSPLKGIEDWLTDQSSAWQPKGPIEMDPQGLPTRKEVWVMEPVDL
jgi:L-ascorbate metabolism protein UlaG (beta-lactamase superfamily)